MAFQIFLKSRRKLLRCLFSFALCLLIGSVPLSAQLIPRSGTHLLPRTNKPYRSATKVQFLPTFNVGDPLTVPAFSFQLIGGGKYQTTTTCRYVGQHCYIFVEDDMWGTTHVTQTGIESLARAFDESTRADPTRGIYDIDTSLFGDAPDADGDPRILIVVLDVLDSPITGVTFVGYVDVDNELPPISREIVYIDANPLAIESNLAKATLAHEFQHLIHWKSDPDEAKWLDEGCSEYAELACGYKDTTTAATEDFLTLATNTDLTHWEDLFFDFDQAYLWMTYFVQRYGESALRNLVADPDSSITNVNNTLQSLNVPERFTDVFGQWSAALYLDQTDQLGYNRIDLTAVKRDSISVPATNIARNALFWGIDYLAFDKATNLALTVHPNGDNDLLITLISDSNLPFATPFTIPSGQNKRIHTFGNTALAITSTSGNAIGYTLSVSELATGPATADFNGNGEVDFPDFLAFAAGFGKSAGELGFDPTFDLNQDREIALPDFLLFVQNFGQTF